MSEGKTFAFSTKSKAWTTRYSFTPSQYAHIDDEFLSCDTFRGLDNTIWEHERGADYNSFYGTTYSTYVAVSSNQDPSKEKVFKAVSLETNEGNWSSVLITNDDAENDIYFKIQQSFIPSFVSKEGNKYSHVPPSERNSTRNLNFLGLVAANEIKSSSVSFSIQGWQAGLDAAITNFFSEYKTNPDATATYPLGIAPYTTPSQVTNLNQKGRFAYLRILPTVNELRTIYMLDEPSDDSELASGQIEGLGATPRMTAKSDKTSICRDVTWGKKDAPKDHAEALGKILNWFEESFKDAEIKAVGHRIVHGGPEYSEPVILTDKILDKLRKYEPLAPLHQPHNLAGVDAAKKAFPKAMQVGCFDTAFHRVHPWVNDTFALPRKYYDEGVRRYGFHGLSYEYVTNELHRIAKPNSDHRTIIAHLGNGASMCAVQDGKSIGSSMGFSALDGLPMGTRCGQIDPGVLLYLMSEHKMDADAITQLLYKESGLKGISGISHDMRELEDANTKESRQAIDYFVFRIRREIGAMAAILRGVDSIVFCGGIGENSAEIRRRVCEGFGWMGLKLNDVKNEKGKTLISKKSSDVNVFVIKTDEEAMIAQHTKELTS